MPDALALHYANGFNKVDLVNCRVRVWPRLATKPICTAMQIDCSKYEGMDGAPAELEVAGFHLMRASSKC